MMSWFASQPPGASSSKDHSKYSIQITKQQVTGRSRGSGEIDLAERRGSLDLGEVSGQVPDPRLELGEIPARALAHRLGWTHPDAPRRREERERETEEAA